MKLHRLREGAAYLFLHVDFEEACGFYSSSNVWRIKCELAGVVRLWTYSCFEALKARDSKRLEPVQLYRYYKIIRKHSKKSTPEGWFSQKEKISMDYSTES